jgi:hypothetical protein
MVHCFELRIIKNPNEYKFSNTFRNNILKRTLIQNLRYIKLHRDISIRSFERTNVQHKSNSETPIADIPIH